MSQASVRQKPGPKPRFTHADLVEAALAVVDADGFSELSLRAVARELGVTAMALYTYVDSRQDLYRLVVDRLISDQLADFVWPDEWQQALRAFAASLSGLIDEHPAIIEAFAAGQMRTEIAMSVADQMLQRLLDGGLPVRAAGVAYAAMHAMVLGHAVLREAGKPQASAGEISAGPVGLADRPALAAYVAAEGRLVDVPLRDMLEILVAGIERLAADPD